MKIVISQLKKVINLNLKTRRLILIFIDALTIIFANLFCKWLLKINIDSGIFLSLENFLLISILIIVYCLTRNYKGITRYTGSNDIYRLCFRNLLVIFLTSLLYSLFNIGLKDYRYWMLLWIFATVFIGFEKVILRDILSKLYLSSNKINNKLVLVYGAGQAGAQLAVSLRSSTTMRIVAFVDDEKRLWGRNIYGIPIVSPEKISFFKKKVKIILFAIPSISKSKRKVILERLQNDGLKVLQVPTMEEITNGQAKIDALRPIQIEDLLGREPVPPNYYLLNKSVRNSSVCITGAGGSIGSELCKQIIKLNPSSLILLEVNEPSLYSIQNELFRNNKRKINIKSILGDTKDENLLKKIFNEEKVNVIFHAAAYKHVPLVEENPFQGISNNVFSTLSICKASLASESVEKMILISSDKAVRPTNIMGTSKRISELIVSSFAKKYSSKNLENNHSKKKSFAMVRFGNVLGSSGSVVPLFYSQLESSKPITLTHPEVTRYFMTITEAAQLVLQAGAMSEGGEVFLLNMGEPIKIYDLAVKMITLSGLKVKNKNSPYGDVEIIYTGLRPGEKLYEELLIEPNSFKTDHPLIYKALEKNIDQKSINKHLILLMDSIKNFNKKEFFNILSKLVPEWSKYDNDKLSY